MKIITLFSGIALLLFASCSPKVITDISRTYPALMSADSVEVIGLGEAVPYSAETIGKVSVVDRGTSTRCHYDQVLHLAQEATAKAGGNGLAITDHQIPSFWGSSCHQISGLMLRLSGAEVDTLKGEPLRSTIDSDLAFVKSAREKRVAPANTVEASIGCGVITSKLYDYNGVSLGHKGGLEWKLSYEHIWKSGMGVGVQYSGFRASFIGGDMILSYLAPEFTGRSKINRWILKYALGLGAAFYHEPSYNSVGVGSHVTLGAEYMLSDHIGLGLSANGIMFRLPGRDGISLDEDEANGINRVNLLGGLRFYF